MSKPSVGLIALWTGELIAHVEHLKNMAIHQMGDVELDQFAKCVRLAGYALSSLDKYVKDEQENS